MCSSLGSYIIGLWDFFVVWSWEHSSHLLEVAIVMGNPWFRLIFESSHPFGRFLALLLVYTLLLKLYVCSVQTISKVISSWPWGIQIVVQVVFPVWLVVLLGLWFMTYRDYDPLSVLVMIIVPNPHVVFDPLWLDPYFTIISLMCLLGCVSITILIPHACVTYLSPITWPFVSS
jgi:hypothetical protein